MRISSDDLPLRCSTCGAIRPPGDYAFANRSKGRLSYVCRECQAAHRRAHYLANKHDYVRHEVARQRRRRERNQRLLMEYLRTHACIDCGNANPVVLEFDHRDDAKKEAIISQLIVRKAWPQVLAEIDKCDVRCVNCHRRRTATQFRWKKALP